MTEPTRRHWSRRWPWALAIAAALLAGIYLALPALVERIAESQLRDRGLDASVAVESIGWGRLSIARLSLHDRRAGFRARMDGVVVRWTWAELLEGRPGSVAVARGEATLHLGDGANGGGAGGAGALPTPAALLRRLPAGRVTLDELTLRVLRVDATWLRAKGALRITPGEGRARLRVRLPRHLPERELDLTLKAFADDRAVLTLAGEGAIDLRAAARVEGSGATIRFSGGVDLALVDELLPGGALPPDYVPLAGRAEWELAARVERSGGDASLRLEPGGRVALESARAGMLRAGAVELRNRSAVTLARRGGAWRHAPASLELATTGLRHTPFRAAHEPLRLEIGAGAWPGPFAVHVSAPGVRLRRAGRRFPASHVEGDARLDGGELTFGLDVASGAGHLRAHLSGRHAPAEGSGEVTFEGEPLRFPGAWPQLAALLPEGLVPADAALERGELRLSGRVRWGGAGLRQRYEFAADGLGGRLGVFRMFGCHTRVTLAGGARLATVEPAEVSVDLLEAGLPVENIRFALALARLGADVPPRLVLTDLSAELLGGRAASERVALDLARAENPFAVRVGGLELSRLLQLERQEGLEGSGVVDGELPFTLRRDGLFIDTGRLAARPPGGTIRYAPDAATRSLGQSSRSMELVLNALSDFRYDRLEAKTDYRPGGDLTLSVRVEGSNPDFYDGRPVILNLNIEENLLDLIESLRTAGEFGREIERRLRDGTDGG